MLNLLLQKLVPSKHMESLLLKADSLVEQFKAHAEAKRQESVRLYDEALRLQDDATEADREADRATRIAARFEDLLS